MKKITNISRIAEISLLLLSMMLLIVIVLYFPNIITYISLLVKKLNKNILHIGAYNWLNIAISSCSLIAAFLAIYFTGKLSRDQMKDQHNETIRNNEYQNKMTELKELTKIIIELLRCFRADDIFRNVQLLVNAKEYKQAIVELDKLNSNIYLYRDKIYFLSDLKEILNDNLHLNNKLFVLYYKDLNECKENINRLITDTENLNINIINDYRDYIYKLLNNYNCLIINEEIEKQIDYLEENFQKHGTDIDDAVFKTLRNNIDQNNNNIIDYRTINQVGEKLDEMLKKYSEKIPELIAALTLEFKKYLQIKEEMALSKLNEK